MAGVRGRSQEFVTSRTRQRRIFVRDFPRDFPHFSLTTGPKQGVFNALPRSVPPNYCV